MIKAQLAKSCMENNEGMNHLLIQISPDTALHHVKIDVNLPYGIYRPRNLNDYDENGQGSISFKEIKEKKEVMLELYTVDEDTPLGNCSINIYLKYRVGQVEQEVKSVVNITLVGENEANEMAINEEVITKIKELPSSDSREKLKERYDIDARSKVLKQSNPFSFLEEKYRVNYSF